MPLQMELMSALMYEILTANVTRKIRLLAMYNDMCGEQRFCSKSFLTVITVELMDGIMRSHVSFIAYQ